MRRICCVIREFSQQYIILRLNISGVIAVHCKNCGDLAAKKLQEMMLVSIIKNMAEEDGMERRIAILGIIVEESESVMAVNDLLHEYREYIIGRMGMPYREKNLSIISIVLDASSEVINALSGKLGMLAGVSSKAVYSKN